MLRVARLNSTPTKLIGRPLGPPTTVAGIPLIRDAGEEGVEQLPHPFPVQADELRREHRVHVLSRVAADRRVHGIECGVGEVVRVGRSLTR